MKRILATLSVVALLGAGCWDKPAAPQVPETVAYDNISDAIKDTWKMTSMKQGSAAAKNVSEFDLTITFDGTKMSGKVCNNMSGDYTVDENDVLKAPTVISTKMFCAGVMGEAESAFTGSLASGYKLSHENNVLTMTSDDGVVLVFSRQ
ncbi:META domain-containing protein [Candidatus Uhrbacteria bacterium]|nr:META domain-containing protein [Candidatus Uhrbacteria bacterium]